MEKSECCGGGCGDLNCNHCGLKTMKTMAIKSQQYCLICIEPADKDIAGSQEHYLICQAGPRKDMIKLKQELKDCPLKHKIIKCVVEIKI